VDSIETLLDDAHALTQRAQGAGVPVELEVSEDMPHVWHHFASILPESQQAIAHIGEFVRKYVAWHPRPSAWPPDIVSESASFPHPAGRNQCSMPEGVFGDQSGPHEASDELRR
jgi:hypothetical protein